MEVLNLPSVVLLIFSLLIPAALPLAQSDFTQDSALAFLHTLSVDIGPRPMGSPAEQRAMQFAIEKFRAFGCQESYIMPMTVAEGVNTKSGIAIGVLKGKTNRIIIIGGHIDSFGPDVPGANDDGSGVACVLELARVLSKSQHESTIMFCCWGGEEQGLEGSKYFVEHFGKLDSVVLMLQIDMADGGSILELDPDYRDISAPQWLTDATYDVFFNELHSSGLMYPTASATLNAASGGSTGSDHDEFLEKGIPAIDFTSDVNYPIHTPQDNFANFTPSGLKRTGDLVSKLVSRFDGGVPSRSTERYMLVQFGAAPMFLPHWLLWVAIVVAVLLAVGAVLKLRKRRVIEEGNAKVRWSGVKLILFALIIQTFVWLSESLMGAMSGHRFPWVGNFGGFVALGALFGMIGLWLVLKALTRLPLTTNAYSFGRCSLSILVVCMLLALLAGVELAAFVAVAVVFMSFALSIRQSVMRIVFWILSVLTVLRLVFFEELGLIQRMLARNTIHTLGGLVVYESLFIVVFTLLSLPFLFGFAGLYRDSGQDLLWLKVFRKRIGLVGTSAAAIVVMIYLLVSRHPDEQWFGRIHVEQACSIGSDSSTITIKASECFRDVKVGTANQELMLDDRTNFHEFHPSERSGVSWCSVDAHSLPAKKASAQDSVWKMDRRVTIHSVMRPYRIDVRYSSALPFEVSSPWAYRRAGRFEKESDTVRVFSWYSFPDTVVDIPVTFTLTDTQRIVEKIEVTYDTLAYPMHLSKDRTDIETRTIVSGFHEFGVEADAMATISERQ